MSESKVTITTAYYYDLLKKENILNELESWLEENIQHYKYEIKNNKKIPYIRIYIEYQVILNRLKEFKGDDE